ncbi:hypothetical protein AB4Z19_27980 [Pseudoduganella sp. RAF19]|uniref:hypothetical protein n=1 Tax=Pseudoduganella sp. RAF19 TaxID=3233052 RepID=UPI003F98101B
MSTIASMPRWANHEGTLATMDIYENIVIGNFLFSLGVAMGRRQDAEGLPISANLLQQTPLDQGCGDVLIRGSRAMRILEFKRAKNDNSKEKAKLLHLTRALSATGNEDLNSISRSVHWYISSMMRDGELNLRIVPYLDFQESQGDGRKFQVFIDDLVSEATKSGSDNSNLYNRYLQLVAMCQGSAKGSSGGVIVSVTNEGKVNYFVVEDLRELGFELSQLHTKFLQRQAQQQREIMPQHERTSRPAGREYTL